MESRTICKSSLIIIMFSIFLVVFSGCGNNVILFDEGNGEKLTKKEVKLLEKSLNIDKFQEDDVFNKYSYFGSPYVFRFICETDDSKSHFGYDYWAIIAHNGMAYCADPYDEYFDAVREVCINHHEYLYDSYPYSERDYKPYFNNAGILWNGKDDYEKKREKNPEIDKYNYGTAISYGIVGINQVYDLYELPYDGEELTPDDIFTGVVKKEKLTVEDINTEIVYGEFKMKLIRVKGGFDNDAVDFPGNCYLIKTVE